MMPPNQGTPRSRTGKTQKSRVRYNIDKEITSKDLNRVEFLKYIFGDFIKGMYIIGCLFLDVLIIAPSFMYFPGFGSVSKSLAMPFGGFDIFLGYYLTLLVLLEFFIVLLQIYFYVSKIRVKLLVESFQKYKVR
jgi:hypothetical protein